MKFKVFLVLMNLIILAGVIGFHVYLWTHRPPVVPLTRVSYGTLPVGLLGKPLGTKIVVQGTMATGVMLGNPLAIEQVNGQRLKGASAITVRGVDIQQGVHYELEGYESGAFEGPPFWLNTGRQKPFQYHPSFIVTRILKPEAPE